jgi:hypothetical protein
MSDQPLTEAEETVARILASGDWEAGVRNCDIGSRETVAQYSRDIVAALRPILAAEALREEAAALEAAIDGGPDLLVVPAHLWLHQRAADRLRAAPCETGGTDADPS